jgi:hypothetical protein
MCRLARESDDVAIVVEIRSVIERDADDEGALPKGVVDRPLKGRDNAGVLTLVQACTRADVDHVGSLVRGVNDPSDESTG